MIVVDAESSPELLKPADVTFAPTILIYRQGKQRMRYYGDWSTSAFTELCHSIADDDLYTLTDSFSVFEFQNRKPANIILSSNFVSKADGLLHKFGGILHVGIVENETLSQIIGLPGALLSRPEEFYSINLTDVEEDTIQRQLLQRIQHIGTNEGFALTDTVDTIVTIVNEDDPVMIYEAVSRLNSLREVLGSNVSYQYCDFFKCHGVVAQLKPITLMSPLYVHHTKQGQRQRIDPYPRIDPTTADIVKWAKFQILGISPPDEPRVLAIPKITAHSFIPVVLDPKRDVVLLVAAPRMQMYDVSVDRFRKLIQIFEGIPEVGFFEFNPITEHVKGLEMPKSDNPQLSIWPATTEQRGSAFAAFVDLELIFENLVRLLETKFSEDQIAEMTQKVAELKDK
jgi:hypothetical protein